MNAGFYEAWDKPEPERDEAYTGPALPVDASDMDRWLAKVCEGIVEAPEGTRNDALNRQAHAAGRKVGAGQLDYHVAAEALTVAARAAGLEAGETRATIASGLKAGEAKPLPLAPRERLAAVPAAPVEVPAPRVNVETGEIAEPERTSWWPRPIGTVVSERADEPDPTQLARDDGHRLFYAGRVNGLLGESESGKTWVALLAVLQALQVAEAVLYLDFEDSAKGIEGRLRLMGATAANLGHLHYASPDEALGFAQQADIAEALQRRYPLVIVDGVNAAMTVMGLDVDSSNKDATIFTQRILRPIADTGAAVVTIDHVPKNKETRGKGAIGAQAKRAMTRGCALRVEVVRPFGPGMAGDLRLTVDKDTPGKVRGVSAGAKVAGTAHIDSSQPGRVAITVAAPDLRTAAERGPFRPTGLMEKVSRLLESTQGGVNGKTIEDTVGGNREYVRTAVAALIEDGFVARESGYRGAVLHTLTKPYRVASDVFDGPSHLARPRPPSDIVADSQFGNDIRTEALSEGDKPGYSRSPDLARPRPDLARGEVRVAHNDLAHSPRPLGRGVGEVKATGPGASSRSPMTGEVEGVEDEDRPDRWWDR